MPPDRPALAERAGLLTTWSISADLPASPLDERLADLRTALSDRIQELGDDRIVDLLEHISTRAQ